MYVPPRYRQKKLPALFGLMREYPFATLVAADPAGGAPLAAHVPVEVGEDGTGSAVLRLHVARANPIGRLLAGGARVRVIFQGPHHYISPAWYDHPNVPTWNYLAVHVEGVARELTGEELYGAMAELTRRYESPNGERAVLMEGLPADYVARELRGIVGAEVRIERLTGAWKLSQNRDAKNLEAVIRELEQLATAEARAIAEEMRKLERGGEG